MSDSSIVKIADVITFAKQLLPELIDDRGDRHAAKISALQLLRTHPGPDSDLYKQAADASRGIAAFLMCRAALTSLVKMYDAGLLTELSLQRRAQTDVLDDIFDQADVILDSGEFHPAAAAVLIGGALEQFLCAWADEKCPQAVGAKRSIDAYASALRSADMIDKTEKKQIDWWAGVRNDAAHGQLQKVDREKVLLMRQAVALFMKQHGAGS